MADESEKSKIEETTNKGVGPSAGLCATCVHVRRVESAKGSVFVLCSLAATDSRLAKYPRLPVLSCNGFATRG